MERAGENWFKEVFNKYHKIVKWKLKVIINIQKWVWGWRWDIWGGEIKRIINL